ncbi:MAG: DNA-binding protein [Betaproteobacteria bacterium]|nr:DNA-binding protein [Betaproteobacteria bacterium]MDE2123584.1 DNA-binding protein [Betaproteobacteria bacterium]MDE2186136.1 DNA-binding protein [Betaproteobacteria bacterium]MDE2323133.1 DNA-binding protein [Betaproteobacteria bacterium]
MPPSAVLVTRDAAAALGKSGQTLRKLYCQQGHAYGIKPLKIGGRLAWKVADLLRVVQGGA